MKIIAHRGASGIEPENTIRSFKKAVEIGVDMIELDVRETKDGELVVIHDHNLKRLFGIKKNVAHATLAELKAISREREIPTLGEVLAEIKSDLIIEVKVHGIERKVHAAIQSFPHKVLISSFYPGVLKKIRALDGNIPLALIIPIKRFHLITVANFLTRKLDLHAVHPRNFITALATMAILRLTGREVNVWTVNSSREYERMKSLGVDGIFTDHPELIQEYEQGNSI